MFVKDHQNMLKLCKLKILSACRLKVNIEVCFKKSSKVQKWYLRSTLAPRIIFTNFIFDSSSSSLSSADFSRVSLETGKDIDILSSFLVSWLLFSFWMLTLCVSSCDIALPEFSFLLDCSTIVSDPTSPVTFSWDSTCTCEVIDSVLISCPSKASVLPTSIEVFDDLLTDEYSEKISYMFS